MTQYVIDACVAIKWFVPEEYAEDARKVLSGKYHLLAPTLLLPEAGNVFWNKIRLQEMSLEDGQRAFTALQNCPIMPIPVGSVAN